MIRKYHNHKLQTNPWHREEEPHNWGLQPFWSSDLKQSNEYSIKQPSDICETNVYIGMWLSK